MTSEHVSDHCLPLTISYTKKYIKIRLRTDRFSPTGDHVGFYHTIIDLKTLDVYFPTDTLKGSLSLKQKPCGNLFDDDILEKIDEFRVQRYKIEN